MPLPGTRTPGHPANACLLPCQGSAPPEYSLQTAEGLGPLVSWGSLPTRHYREKPRKLHGFGLACAGSWKAADRLLQGAWTTATRRAILDSIWHIDGTNKP
jgi:hypothetical protein